MAEIKKIEVTYGVKRPIARYSSENISVTLGADVKAESEEGLKKEIHTAFSKARDFVEVEQWRSDRERANIQKN